MTEAFAPVQREGVIHGVVPLCCIASKWFSRRESIHLRCRLVSRREGPHARILTLPTLPCGVIRKGESLQDISYWALLIAAMGLGETTF